MHDPWTHMKAAFEKAIAHLEKKEPAHARSALKDIEHTARTVGEKLKGPERDRAGRIYKASQAAIHMIDPAKALEVLRAAASAFDGTSPPASPPPA